MNHNPPPSLGKKPKKKIVRIPKASKVKSEFDYWIQSHDQLVRLERMCIEDLKDEPAKKIRVFGTGTLAHFNVTVVCKYGTVPSRMDFQVDARRTLAEDWFKEYKQMPWTVTKL